jgi:hypothetical protein
LLRSHAANYALFISGIFADNVENARVSEGARPVLYEAVGQMNHRAASEYREAKRFKLQSIYEELAGGLGSASGLERFGEPASAS